MYLSHTMYGIFTYIWESFMANLGKEAIHGWYGYIYSFMDPSSIYAPTWRLWLPMYLPHLIVSVNLHQSYTII